MKVSAILLVIGVSWVAAHPGLFDWRDNANKLFGGWSKNDMDDDSSEGGTKGLLGPVKGILDNVNSWGSKLIPASILDNDDLAKLDVLNIWSKGDDDGKVKDAMSPLANIFGPDNLVSSLISSAVGSVKESGLGDVMDKFTGGMMGGKGGREKKSSRMSSYRKSSESSGKESDSESESSKSSKSESFLRKDGKAGKIEELITEESESEQKEKSSGSESEQKSSEESSIVEETEETSD